MMIASDLEGTLTTGETWRGIRAYLSTHGRKGEFYGFFASQLPEFLGSKLGLVAKREFQNRWTARILRLFTGISETEFAGIAAWVAEHELLPKIRPTVLKRLQAHQQAGARVILASGTYQPVLEAVAGQFGFEALGTPLEIKNSKLTGRIVGEISVGAAKKRRLEQALLGQTLEAAYGDTLPDAPMLDLAKTAFVVPGNDAALEALAAAKGWQVLESDHDSSVDR
jgi:HAD superfamily phosphoserine phosphatase-like hydrolase